MNRLWALVVGAGVLAGGLLLHSSYQAGAAPRLQDEAKPKASLKRSVAASREDDEAIRKNVAAFSKAFNAGDLNGVMAGWSEDAEFIHESGKVYRGKPAIRVMLQKALEGYKGHKQAIKIDSIRFVCPDVALEEGTVTMTSPENVVDTGKYSSVWVKAGGKWHMDRVRDLPDAAEDDRPASFDKLKGLNWMLGEWGDKEGKGRVKLACKWSEGQAYFLQDFVIKQADGKDFFVSQRVGWDPAMEQVRSWQFDSAGGFSFGWWTREGNSWSIQTEGVYPDGRQFTSTDTLKFIDDNNAVWASKNREVDEQPLADIELSFTRVTKDR
jgi:uncharacterized protein (TIGR02246 family)